MIKFEKRFLRVISEQDDVTPDEMAMKGSLDQGTSPDDLGADVDSGDVAQKTVSDIQDQHGKHQQMISQIQNWIKTIDEFENYLNGDSNDSINRILGQSEADTIFDKIKSKEQTAITRVSADLLRGAINAAPSPTLKYV